MRITLETFLLRSIIGGLIQETFSLAIFKNENFLIEIMAKTSQEKEFIIHREGNYEEKYYVRKGYLSIERCADLAYGKNPSKIGIIGMENLKTLERLGMIRFPMKEILESVQFPRTLRLLRLQKCFFTNSANYNLLRKPENLKSLIIQEPIYKERDPFTLKWLRDLDFLEEFQVNFDNISQIQYLENFKNLRILELVDNKISKIEGLDNLRKLEELWLDANRIKKIEGLDNLFQLRVLSLGYNEITQIEGLNNLVNLEQLDLSYNKIFKEYWIKKADIQKYIGNLEKLKKLNFTTYPESKKYPFPKNILKV